MTLDLFLHPPHPYSRFYFAPTKRSRPHAVFREGRHAFDSFLLLQPICPRLMDNELDWVLKQTMARLPTDIAKIPSDAFCECWPSSTLCADILVEVGIFIHLLKMITVILGQFLSRIIRLTEPGIP